MLTGAKKVTDRSGQRVLIGSPLIHSPTLDLCGWPVALALAGF